jgi:septal ring factor EnvC (AmiA/AmiB activator)
MIQLPRRSVTRFFIPLVDVMTLLFCMFLLLPNFRQSVPDNVDPEKVPTEDNLRRLQSEVERLKGEKKELQRQLDDPDRENAALRKRVRELEALVESLRSQVRLLQKRLATPLEQRMAIRLVEIDPADGRLFYYEPGQPPRKKYLETAAQVEALILHHKRELVDRYKDRTAPELHYLFVFPRVDSAYPTGRQVQQYKKWFEGVSHSFDQPGGA